jgi:hypothetical protein
MTLHSFRDRTLGVIPIRVGLGVLLLGAARLAGAPNGPALLAFVLGIFGIVFVIFNDPRARFAHGEVDPLELLAGVEAGLGVAAVLSVGRVDPRLYVDSSTRVVYRR